jgi:hypothetical protein
MTAGLRLALQFVTHSNFQEIKFIVYLDDFIAPKFEFSH